MFAKGRIFVKPYDTHCNGVRHEHDDNDQKKTGYVAPGSLQCSCDHVHLWVQSEQVPQFDSSKKDDEGDEILEH